METLAAAYKYVAERFALGRLNKRSAEQARSRLVSFCEAVPADPWRVRTVHVVKWLERPDLSPHYQRGRLSTVRGFCGWCVSHALMRQDPTVGVELGPLPLSLPKRLTRDEAVATVQAAPDTRARLAVMLMLHLGLRRAEVAALRVEDIDPAERSVVIRGKGGHGGETDALPIPGELWSVLTGYLAETGARHGPLLRSYKHPERGISGQHISEIVRRMMVDAGVKRPGDTSRTPHSCRHSAAHDLLDRTRDVRAVQQALRHRSVRSTEVYLRGHVAELRPVLEGRTYLHA